MTLLDAQAWNEFLSDHADVHVLQTSAWGELKSAFGWKPVRVVVDGCGAQILFRRLPMGFTVAYMPKGPIGSDSQDFWLEIEQVCRRYRAIFLKIEPDLWEGQTWLPGTGIQGLIDSKPIQPRRTVEISLAGREEDWLARMKQKTRYNVRLAEKKDVVVQRSDDVAAFHKLMLTTGTREAFGVHSRAYYQRAFDLFSPNNKCAMLIASFEGWPLAGLMVFIQGQRAWYFYGASSNLERNRMPAYLLQFEAMRWAASQGCQVYDLWGIPDSAEETLEEQFADRDDGLWGVYRFKRGFGGVIRRSIGAWDRVFMPPLYQVYKLYSEKRSGE